MISVFLQRLSILVAALVLVACSTTSVFDDGLTEIQTVPIEGTFQSSDVDVTDMAIDSSVITFQVNEEFVGTSESYQNKKIKTEKTLGYEGCLSRDYAYLFSLNAEDDGLAGLVTLFLGIPLTPVLCIFSTNDTETSKVEILDEKINVTRNESIVLKPYDKPLSVSVFQPATGFKKVLTTRSRSNGKYSIDVLDVVADLPARSSQLDLEFQFDKSNKTVTLKEDDLAAMGELAWRVQEAGLDVVLSEKRKELEAHIANRRLDSAQRILTEMREISSPSHPTIASASQALQEARAYERQEAERKARLSAASEMKLEGRWSWRSGKKTWVFYSDGTGENIQESVNNMPATLTIYFDWRCDCKNNVLYYQQKRAVMTGSINRSKNINRQEDRQPFNLDGNVLTIGGNPYIKQ